MAKIAICTSLYEAGRRFLPDFLTAFDGARRGTRHEIGLIAAIDDLREPERALEGVESPVIVGAEPGSTVADIRNAMLRGGLASNADALVFVDMDDRIAPGAPDAYVEALRDAEIAFGDLQPIDETGRPLGRCFFDGANVPAQVRGVEAIAARNFLGFSNSGVRRAAIPDEAMHIPAGLVACDWWFHSRLLMAGLSAACMPKVVADYRVYGGNTLGATPDPSPDATLRRCTIVLQHYASLPEHPAYVGRADAVSRLGRKIEAEGTRLTDTLAAACAEPGVWFEDIARLVTRV